MHQEFLQARASTKQHLAETGVTHHMFYGPTTNRYWSEPFKIAAVNMEPYGYAALGLYDVCRDDLVDWTYDAGDTRTKTTRYTLAILSVALECFARRLSPSREMLSKAFSDHEMIEDTLDRTVYYNIRPQSNTVKPQDYAAISAVGSSDSGRYVWAEITALEPDVIFVGGHATLCAVNQLISPLGPIPFRHGAEAARCFIHSIPHPSRPAYDSWCAAIDNALNWIHKNRR